VSVGMGLTSVITGASTHAACRAGLRPSEGPLTRRLWARPSQSCAISLVGVAEGPPDASRQDCNTLHTYEALPCF
jgi:hypothetical protein